MEGANEGMEAGEAGVASYRITCQAVLHNAQFHTRLFFTHRSSLRRRCERRVPGGSCLPTHWRWRVKRGDGA